MAAIAFPLVDEATPADDAVSEVQPGPASDGDPELEPVGGDEPEPADLGGTDADHDGLGGPVPAELEQSPVLEAEPPAESPLEPFGEPELQPALVDEAGPADDAHAEVEPGPEPLVSDPEPDQEAVAEAASEPEPAALPYLVAELGGAHLDEAVATEAAKSEAVPEHENERYGGPATAPLPLPEPEPEPESVPEPAVDQPVGHPGWGEEPAAAAAFLSSGLREEVPTEPGDGAPDAPVPAATSHPVTVSWRGAGDMEYLELDGPKEGDTDELIIVEPPSQLFVQNRRRRTPHPPEGDADHADQADHATTSSGPAR